MSISLEIKMNNRSQHEKWAAHLIECTFASWLMIQGRIGTSFAVVALSDRWPVIKGGLSTTDFLCKEQINLISLSSK